MNAGTEIAALFGGQGLFLLSLVLLWSLPWKGVALWKAARTEQKKWFIALFLMNTVGILEILFIFYFSKRKSGEREGPSLPSATSL